MLHRCNINVQEMLLMKLSIFQDVGMAHICEGISEQGSLGIETLVVWNNQLTYQSMNSLCKALVSWTAYVYISHAISMFLSLIVNFMHVKLLHFENVFFEIGLKQFIDRYKEPAGHKPREK